MPSWKAIRAACSTTKLGGLGAAMEHAAALAQWRNQVLGVSVGDAGYRFWRRESTVEGDRWMPLTDDDVLLPHALGSEMAAHIASYAGQPVADDADRAARAERPQ